MMNFEFMERITSTETYEWIGLLPTPVLRELATGQQLRN
ncbi:hypothetical protein Aaci_3148 (plasmid) [Alicyclobacillus acidocaldarius subsp. acidocaldarius DSM 446]|uniref:Uncharacterized protein n=1 Tax=Alicyclobacillus acidocaldarius subsp. acidocaldarius (strain ATCC 27009 / DSM 446 / BCRC 14685 / JCM 5260 / KCTC 1825 / NBRC 15652 / NCIMB 11725 / NRRL B-14509 / 104-IA) TaxID=521098 RepID=C8WYQ0_ALIAD|nr:hypothetical protein Aaci_3148 [Alicyclobacillus acidocaldarius subsp. acidocaldarius DSM 446]